jgi:GT2 family glycosyltransferase
MIDKVPQERGIITPTCVVPGRIGVVTVLFDSSSVLPGFFASLASQEHQDFHVWAVDNASTDDSVTQCRAQGDRFTVIANPTNLYYFDRPDVIWAAGGRFQPLLGYRCYHLQDGVEDVGQFTAPRRVQHAPTCCVLFKRSVFETVGFMDERYFVYHDDTDFMLRCLKADQRLILLPQAKLLHKVSSLTGGAESEFSMRMGTRNRIYMLTKFLGRGLALPYVAGLALTYLTRRLLRQYDRERYFLKQASLSQGFSMAANWVPYHTLRQAVSQRSLLK